MGWDTGGGGAAASASINFTGAGGRVSREKKHLCDL